MEAASPGSSLGSFALKGSRAMEMEGTWGSNVTLVGNDPRVDVEGL